MFSAPNEAVELALNQGQFAGFHDAGKRLFENRLDSGSLYLAFHTDLGVHLRSDLVGNGFLYLEQLYLILTNVQ
jgi:hypothetical protein